VIGVIVRQDYVLDRLVGEGLEFGDQVVMFAIALAVDQEDSGVG